MKISEALQNAIDEALRSAEEELCRGYQLRMADYQRDVERARAQQAESEAWLAKIRHALTNAELVRGDYEASVKALIDDHRELQRLKKDITRRVDGFVPQERYDSAQNQIAMFSDELAQARTERDEAMKLLKSLVDNEAAYSRAILDAHDFLIQTEP